MNPTGGYGMAARKKKKVARKKAPAKRSPRRPRKDPAEQRKSKLGGKWVCFACGAKFYDLNKPEPICPKCETDQRTRPKETRPAPRPAKKTRKADRPLTSLLEEEEQREAPEPYEGDDLELAIDGMDDPEEALGASLDD